MESSHVFILFNLFVLAVLALDLGVLHRRARTPSFRDAAFWSAFWVGISLAFNVVVYFWRGPQPALEFLTAYVLEKSLSVDNLVVFALIFGSMAVPVEFQHKVLFWGVLGALVMRAVFIILGVALMARFHWVLYIFGGLLVGAGLKSLLGKSSKVDPVRNPLLRLAGKVLPISKTYEGESFFFWRSGRLLATPLLLALLMVEATDFMFTLDSIPAVFGVTRDPFIAYSSNILAMLGLRSLYFVLTGAMAKLRYLHAGLSVLLIFLGSKIAVSNFFELPVAYSLLVISVILGVATFASLRAQSSPYAPHQPVPKLPGRCW